MTGFVFNTVLVAIAFLLIKGNLTIGVLNLIQVVNSLPFIVLPVATEKLGAVNLWSQNVEHVM